MVPVKDFEATIGCHKAVLLSYGQPHWSHVSFRTLAQEREVQQSQLLPGPAAPGDTRDKKPQQHAPTVGSISTAGGGPAPNCPPTMPFVLYYPTCSVRRETKSLPLSNLLQINKVLILRQIVIFLQL